jgi:hypothetical protein
LAMHRSFTLLCQMADLETLGSNDTSHIAMPLALHQ